VNNKDDVLLMIYLSPVKEFSVSDVADILQRGNTTIRYWLRRGMLKGTRRYSYGKARLVILKHDLLDCIEHNVYSCNLIDLEELEDILEDIEQRRK
jgi:transposase